MLIHLYAITTKICKSSDLMSNGRARLPPSLVAAKGNGSGGPSPSRDSNNVFIKSELLHDNA